MNKITVSILVVLLLGGGWYFYQNDKKADLSQESSEVSIEFGDDGDEGGTPVDASLVVSESIVGKWKSTEDAKFTREFQSGGVVIDMYDSGSVSKGTWVVFSGMKPLGVSFPLEATAVYVQLTMSGSQAQTLNFKLGKLTPEELELVYMDRGNTLVFTRVE